MRVDKAMLVRWSKYAQAICNEYGVSMLAVDTPAKAWTVAHKIDIPHEAYHVGLNDNHIETALKRIFPAAWE